MVHETSVIRLEHLYLNSGCCETHVVHFHRSAHIQITLPFFFFSLSFFFFFFFKFHLPSLPGVTQEGVYRTVGSNIQVQKLLNAFFGKEITLRTRSTSVHLLHFFTWVSPQTQPVLQPPGCVNDEEVSAGHWIAALVFFMASTWK